MQTLVSVSRGFIKEEMKSDSKHEYVDLSNFNIPHTTNSNSCHVTCENETLRGHNVIGMSVSTLYKIRGGSRISGKGVHMNKGVGVSHC